MRLWELTPLVAAVAFLFSAFMVLMQLRKTRGDRFVAITSVLFQIWQSPEFMKSQLWIIHEMKAVTWNDFMAQHAGKEGEAAFLRVTGFYNRVGTLVHLKLVDNRPLLRTIGGTACEVWYKVAPLVPGARQHHLTFLQDFEHLLAYLPEVRPGWQAAHTADR